MRVLLTCPPMLRSFQHVAHHFEAAGVECVRPDVTQILQEEELISLVPQFDGWIIGDDPATRAVFEAGKRGKLRAAVKWGVGVDNVDLAAARDLGLPITNTPGMFGTEVADIAIGYIIALARHTFVIDRGVRAGEWPKPVGISLAGKTVALVGFGDIGRNTARRLLVCGMNVLVYDPFYKAVDGIAPVTPEQWPNRLHEADFIVLSCALTPENRHLLNTISLGLCKNGVRIVSVSRGPLIDEAALANALQSGLVAGAALEVAETEPLPLASPLRQFPQCIFGSHNASNTLEAVIRTSERAISDLFSFLGLASR